MTQVVNPHTCGLTVVYAPITPCQAAQAALETPCEGGALLTIARGWCAAGRPMPEEVPAMGSFQDWCNAMAGMLSHAGISGFLGNVDVFESRQPEPRGRRVDGLSGCLARGLWQ